MVVAGVVVGVVGCVCGSGGRVGRKGGRVGCGVSWGRQTEGKSPSCPGTKMTTQTQFDPGTCETRSHIKSSKLALPVDKD